MNEIIKSFNSRGLEVAVKKAWYESSAVNFDKLEQPFIKALITFCPLYKLGSLKRSQLMVSQVSIEESRVANKWAALKKVLTAMQSHLTDMGGVLDLHAVFADKAVLLAGVPTEKDYQALNEHSALYKLTLDQFCIEQSLNYTYRRYTDLSVPGPDFVNPNAKIPGANNGLTASELIGHLNAFLESESISSQVTNNNKNRKLVEKLHSLGGKSSSEEVYWLVTGYLAFDYMIPSLAGENGVYLATERFEPLFGISNMTPSLKEMARVHIKS